MKCSKCRNEARENRTLCESCAEKRKIQGKQYREKNKDRILQRMKDYHAANRDRNVARSREYRQKNLEVRKQKDREYYQTHKEQKKDYAKQYRKDNVEKCREWDRRKDKETKKKYNKMYWQLNHEKLREYGRIRNMIQYQLNKEKIDERNRQWSRNNKEACVKLALRYKTRKINAFVEDVDRVEIFERDNWVCLLCFRPVMRDVDSSHPMSPTIDHIVPLSRGGLHERKNLQTAHRRCNTSKGTRSLTDYYTIKGLL